MVGGNKKEVLDAILLQESFVVGTLSLDKGKCGYFVCISGWFGPLRGPPGVTKGRFRMSEYKLGRWN